MINTGPPAGLRDIERTLFRAIAVLGRDAGEELKTTGRTIAVELANNQFPQAAGGRSRMENAYTADSLRVFATPASVYAALQRQEPAKAAQWQALEGGGRGGRARLAGFLATTHLAGLEIINAPRPELMDPFRRTRRKRVVIRKPRYLVTGRNGLSSMLKKKQRKVGLSASGWAHAAKSLGGTRVIPAEKNTGRHKQGKGRAVLTRSGTRTTLVLHNDMDYATENLPSFYIDRAVRSAGRKLENRLARLAAIHARRTRF